MKKLMLSLVAVAMTAGLVEAQTNVLSKNAVGYVKIPVDSNKIYLVSTPFVNMEDGSDYHLVTNVFASVPNRTIITPWRDAEQTYAVYQKSARGAWNPGAETSVIKRGTAVFVRMPGETSTNLFFMGEVPDDTTAPSTMQSRVPGLSFVGNPYPASVSFTGSAMAISAPNRAIVTIWDPVNQTYIVHQKSARGAWNPAALTAELTPGEGFIIRSSEGPSNWTEVKPYTWP